MNQDMSKTAAEEELNSKMANMVLVPLNQGIQC